MRHIPKKIYLQIGEDCDAEDFKELSEVSWCQDKIYSNDIEYVRSSQQPEDEVVEALMLILPLAKGYVANNKVGSNQAYIEQAQAILAKTEGGKMTDNPQAFPRPNMCHDESMTLRDWFAGKALSGVLKQVTNECERRQSWPPDWRNGVASDCYSIADAMLEARKERHDKAN